MQGLWAIVRRGVSDEMGLGRDRNSPQLVSVHTAFMVLTLTEKTGCQQFRFKSVTRLYIKSFLFSSFVALLPGTSCQDCKELVSAWRCTTEVHRRSRPQTRQDTNTDSWTHFQISNYQLPHKQIHGQRNVPAIRKRWHSRKRWIYPGRLRPQKCISFYHSAWKFWKQISALTWGDESALRANRRWSSRFGCTVVFHARRFSSVDRLAPSGDSGWVRELWRSMLSDCCHQVRVLHDDCKPFFGAKVWNTTSGHRLIRNENGGIFVDLPE